MDAKRRFVTGIIDITFASFHNTRTKFFTIKIILKTHFTKVSKIIKKKLLKVKHIRLKLYVICKFKISDKIKFIKQLARSSLE